MELIAVVVGAVLGYGAGWVQQRLDRRRRRSGFASAMLLELRRVERNLREIAGSERAADASVRFPLDVHRQAMAELDLFKPLTIAAIFDFLSTIADVEHGMHLIANGRADRGENRTWEQRTRATFAANRIDAVKALLQEEGGRIAPGRDITRERANFPQLPPLDPPSFPQPFRPTDLGS
jgi:phytoene/squalene synthetase